MDLIFAAPHHPHQQPNGAVSKQNETLTPLTSLILAMENANQTAKRLSSSPASPSETLAALASLRDAHQTIGSFLAQLGSQPSVSDRDEPMSDRRAEEEEEEAEGGGEATRIIEEVEEGMRECVLQTKRRKRQMSPSWTPGRAADQGEDLSSVDPMDRRRSPFGLVFQFHA